MENPVTHPDKDGHTWIVPLVTVTRMRYPARTAYDGREYPETTITVIGCPCGARRPAFPVSDRMQRPKIGKRCGHHCFAQRALGGKVEPLVVTHCGCPECHDELVRKHTVVYGE